MTSTGVFTGDIERAAKEMLSMSKRAKSHADCGKKTAALNQKNSNSSINIQSDTLLILGLILILSNENCDKLLLLAMLYILS